MEPMTKGELVKFVDMITAKGLVNLNTGAGYKAAVNRILGDVPAEQDPRKIDVRTEVLRYNNLHPGELSPNSLKEYERRIGQIIALFVSYKTNPTAFKAPQRGTTTSTGKADGEKPKAKTSRGKAKPPRGKKPATPAAPHQAPSASGSPSPASQGPTIGTATEMNLVLPYPLRSDYLAQVLVPRNMTIDEAERLCGFIRSLAQAPKK